MEIKSNMEVEITIKDQVSSLDGLLLLTTWTLKKANQKDYLSKTESLIKQVKIAIKFSNTMLVENK